MVRVVQKKTHGFSVLCLLLFRVLTDLIGLALTRMGATGSYGSISSRRQEVRRPHHRW